MEVVELVQEAGPQWGGQHPFRPRLIKNRAGDLVVEKRAVASGPKRGKRGYVDDQGRIWVKDRAHAGVPDHWDVQVGGGSDYFRVDLDGNEL